jgi:hypothetical protein
VDIDDELIEKLILDGFVEFAGLDHNNEMLYSFAEDIDVRAPGMYEMMIDMRMKDIRALWSLGFLSMNIDESNPTVTITEKALDDDALASLDMDLYIALQGIKDLMLKKGDEWNT